MARSTEIRLWWPLPLAVLVWLTIIWGIGFFLTVPEVTETPPPIEARFIELPESEQDQTPTMASRQQPESQPQKQVAKPRTATKPVQKVPPPLPAERPKITPNAIKNIETAKALPEKERAKVATPATPNSAAPTDLSDYINQARARRRADDIFNGYENTETVASKPQPSAEDVRMARVRRNLQVPGTSGIFRIISIGPRYAQFSFNAWTTGVGNTRHTLIEVKIGQDGDMERAIIRRMIQLIRQHHQGDFNWESIRLNRVVVLSSRISDNDGLEDFMMREFFY